MTATLERRTACLRISAPDGDTRRLALDYPHNLVMAGGELYIGGLVLSRSSANATLDGGPAVIDVGSIYDQSATERDEIYSGKWDGAWVRLFYTDWANPVEDEEPSGIYQVGKVRAEDDRVTLELLSLRDLLGQTTGRVITPSCQWIFADSHVNGEVIASDRSRCGLFGEDYDVQSEITGLGSGPTEFFAGTLQAYPDDWFSYGEIVFTSGANAGLTWHYVSKFESSFGRVELAAPFYYAVQVGDQFTIRAGCRKRRDADCVDKFDNAVRFGGFPDVPQKSSVIKFGGQ